MIPKSRAEIPVDSLPQDPRGKRPLTDGQRALWFLQRLRPDAAAWNIAAAGRVQGKLDPRRLCEAFERLAERHEALRLTFNDTPDGPMQWGRTGSSVDFRVVDASCWSEEQVGEALQSEADRPFAFSREPLLRVRLLHTAADDVLLLVVHHLVADLGSLAILVRELGPLYAGENAGPPPALQYVDCADRLTDRLQGRAGERHWAYWRERLSGELPVCELPADHPRPPVRTFAGGSRTARLGKGVTERLRSLASEHRATLFMTLLAGLDVLLHRASGETDVLVGSPTSGRLASGLEGTVGYFVNPVVLRSDLAGNPTLHELLERVRGTVLGALRHQEFPFARLVERLHPERDPAQSPLFQVMFAFQRAHLPGTGDLAAFAMGIEGAEVRTGPLALTSLPLERRFSQFDLELTAAETGRGTELALAFNADLFEPVTAERFLGHLVTLLAAAVEGADRRIGEVPLLTEAERHQLARWNETSSPLPDLPVHELFEEQAALTPDATAVSAPDGILTYGELSARSNSVAQALAKAGVLPEEPVAVWTERGAFLLTALLGILKAGGVYFPLNPDHPATRLQGLLARSKTRLVLAADPSRCQTSFPNLRVIEIGQPGRRRQLPRVGWGLEGAAYLLFTSGSTGEPKGVLVTHRGLLNHVLSKVHGVGLTPSDRVAQTAPQSFDISIWQLLGPLLVGARVEVVPDSIVREPDRLLAEIDARAVSVIHVVPALLAALVDEVEKGTGGMAMRRLIASGEVLSPEVARRWLAARPGVPLVNGYGPTECADIVSEANLSKIPEGAAHTSIGRPIANLRLHVLSPELEPQPIGFPGEVCIAGMGVGRGYLDDPAQTAAAFIPDPFSGEPGGRLYRTGDLGRRRADGELEILRRIDHQIKIRGFRIEPAEIEAVLVQHPAVAQAVVLATETAAGGWALVACFRTRKGEPPQVDELRSLASARLPSHMVPSMFIPLDVFPVTSNGKVNRKALAQQVRWERSQPRRNGSDKGTTPFEDLLAGIWSEVLGVDLVLPEDNFFELGGHSLLATQVVSRIRKIFGVELPVRALFEEPKLAGLARRVAATATPAAATVPPPIVPVPRDQHLPLSFAQQRLWFLDRLRPEAGVYKMAGAFRLSSTLDVPALSGALNGLMDRHEALRTCFPVVDGAPVQHIVEPQPVSLPMVDLSGLPPEVSEVELLRQVVADAYRGFDLGKGPLLRTLLVRSGPKDYALLLSVHHTVADGWSLGIMMRELKIGYRALSQGQAPNLPNLPVQYADFAVWQRRWLQGETIEREISYWQRQLAGLPEVLELSTDHPRPPIQSFRGDRLDLALSAEVHGALLRFGRQAGSSLFMTLVAGLNALLHRYTGQERFAVGTPIANRNHAEIEGLVGNFANTLVLAASAEGARTFRELVEQVRETALDAYTHQDLPFESLVEALSPARDLAYNPLFQVLLGLHNLPDALEPGLELQPLERVGAVARFDLALDFVEASQGLRGEIEYATDLFDRVSVARLANQLEVLLAGAAADPNRRIAELPLLTPLERQQLREWNDTRSEFLPACLHERFELWALRRPEAVAVVCGTERLSYGELDRRAGAVARRLRNLGVGPEAPVGVYLERSVEMVVALLGVLKAGGAYVPVDPASPRQRVSWIFDAARVNVIVTRRDLTPQLPELGVPVLDLDEELPTPEDRPVSGVTPEHTAYVIFTSGSSGRPKGVQVDHRSVTHLLETARSRFDFGPHDVWTVVHSYAFDFSVWEIWGALALGGRLVVVPVEVARSPVELARLLEEEEVTVLNQTPSALRQLVETVDRLPASLRLIVCGGEALPRELAPRLVSWGVPLWNFYGPTEATVWCAAGPVPAHGEGSAGAVPLGRPLPGARLLVLGPELELMPAGAGGELCIAGSGLARGYFREPALTAAAFVPDPFGAPGGRLYRSGDRARSLTDGTLDFLGRMDQQLKIRGIRIEPGEVESALVSHPGVREAVVALRGEQLFAWWVGDPAAEPTLRRHLRERLPEAMVPARLHRLDALPLTPHGKVDRRALPDPAMVGDADDAPVGPIEEMVAAIWSRVLDTERIGRRRSFFDLGGHSLLATRVMSRVNLDFQTALPLRVLFEAPTVAGLAQLISEARHEQAPAPPFARIPRGEPLPPSFAQERLWVVHRLNPGIPAYNVFQALELTGPVDERALAHAFAEVVRRHETLRTRFTTLQGALKQVVSGWQLGSLPEVDLRALPWAALQTETDRLTQREARRPFDLERGPLLRITLLRSGETKRRLLLALHHIICDGWSGDLLVREIGALYRGQQLPEPPFQYADYADWQRRWPVELVDDQLAWWAGQLAGMATLQLPTDHPRPAIQTFRGDSFVVTLPYDLPEKLRELARGRQVTLFMLVLAAWQTLLHRITGQTDVVVGSPMANRGRAEIEDLIGFFVNNLVLRANLADRPTFDEVLARVRETALSAYVHQDLPFERLVEELAPERDLSRSSLFQVAFSFQQALPSPDLGPDLGADLLFAHTGTAKLDLSLLVEQERAGWTARVEFATDLFDAVTVRRWLGHLQILLEETAGAPEARVSELPLLSQCERHHLVTEWNDTGGDYRQTTGTVHQLFEEQVARTPDALAVISTDVQLTYTELDLLADVLAERLLALGVQTDDCVALLVERSPELIVALLAILKAGAAYVPLDPDLPVERLAFLLDDLRPPLVLAPRRLLPRLSACSATVVCLENDGLQPAASVPPVRPEGIPESLAYVLYTSGSTGDPKPVGVPHAALVEHILAVADLLGLSERDRVLFFASPSFDVSLEQLLPALVRGATVVVRGTELWPPSEFSQVANRLGLTVAQLPTAYWRQWVRESISGEPPALRLVTAGGEAMPVEDALLWRQSPWSRVRLINAYGPTEGVITATMFEVDAASASPTGPVALGRPLAGRSAAIVDFFGQLQPVGVEGELCLGGNPLARGYLGRPDLTAERFVPDPGSPTPGRRLYRTGDLARSLPDGNLQFHGRIDHQVKIRGFRVEPDEIEAVLRQYPGVCEAVVVAREDRPNDRRLVAYTVSNLAQPPSPDELRSWLRKKLPEAMVPSAFVPLDALPLTVSGKVDRHALPILLAEPAPPPEGPRTPLETLVAGVFAEVLGISAVPVDVRFFDLGGNSLLATQVVSLLQDVLPIQLDLRRVLEGPTVARLAELLEEQTAALPDRERQATAEILAELESDDLLLSRGAA